MSVNMKTKIQWTFIYLLVLVHVFITSVGLHAYVHVNKNNLEAVWALNYVNYIFGIVALISIYRKCYLVFEKVEDFPVDICWYLFRDISENISFMFI